VAGTTVTLTWNHCNLKVTMDCLSMIACSLCNFMKLVPITDYVGFAVHTEIEI